MKEIILTKGQVVLVDDEDYDHLNIFKWCARWAPNTKSYYAARLTRIFEGLPKRTVQMHSQITGWSLVDHIDHDTLNNQRSNLREATYTQNNQNKRPVPGKTSEYKGVYWAEDRGKWIANITVNGKRLKLGNFEDEIQAALAYNLAAIEYFKEFAYLNDLPKNLIQLNSIPDQRQTARRRWAKLNTNQIKEIKALKGVKYQREVADIYNIAQTTVGRIWSGKIWPDITDD